MKQIEITQRYRPYSHLLGTTCLLPGTPYALRFWPEKLELFDWERSQHKPIETFHIHIKGPVRNFTVMQDLERQQLSLTMHTQEGYLNYFIRHSRKEPFLFVKKAPQSTLKIDHLTLAHSTYLNLLNKEIKEALPRAEPTKQWARLSFGSHKKPCWEHMQERGALHEIFPYWFHLGQQYTISDTLTEGEDLFGQCRNAVALSDNMQVYSAFKVLYQTMFHGLLLPFTSDQKSQGIPLAPSQVYTPLQLLAHSAQLIRSQIIHYQTNQLFLLPCVSPEFHCGRLTGASIGQIGTVSLEWSKKSIKKCEIQIKENNHCQLCLPSAIRSFRLRKNRTDKGVRMSVDKELTFEAGETYRLDRFEK